MFNVGSAQGYLKLNTTGWATSMRGANASLTSLSRSFSRMGMVAVGSLTLITREFGKFDKAIRHATSVSETTSAQFDEMSRMALDASVRWNKAATSTAQAFYFLGSAGLTVTEQLQAFNTTIMLSRAMGSELAQTVEGTVDVVRAFGLEFADIDRIADQLTKTVISSNQQFRTLSQALTYASSTARLTNNTLAETTAMLGVMANAGIKGSMAGTVLRRAMTNLMAPTGGMASLVYELGLNIYDSTGKMKPFINIMGEISDQLKGATDSYKNMVFETLFGRRAIAGQIVLFNYGSRALRKYASEIENASGVTRDVANKQMKAFSEQLGQLWQQIKRVSIAIGGTLTPAIERLGDAIQGRLTIFEAYIEANKDMIAEALKLTMVFGTALAVGGPLLLILTGLVTNFVTLAAVVASPFVVLVAALYTFRALWNQTTDEMKKNAKDLNAAIAEKANMNIGPTGQTLAYGAAGAIAGAGLGPWGMGIGGAAGLAAGGIQAWRGIQARNARLYGGRQVMGGELHGRLPGGYMMGGRSLGGMDKSYARIGPQNGKSEGDIKGSLEKLIADTWGAATEQFKQDTKGVMDGIIKGLRESSPELAALLDKSKAALKTIEDMLKAFMRPPDPALTKVGKDIDALIKKSRKLHTVWADGLLTDEDATEYVKRFGMLKEHWNNAVREMFRPLVVTDTWESKFGSAMKNIETSWSDTMNTMMNEGGNWKDFMENMFTGVLASFNRMISDVLAHNLANAMFGGGEKMTAGTASIWDIINTIFNTDYGKQGRGAVEADLTEAPTVWDPSRGLPGVDPYKGSIQAPVIINIENRGAPVDMSASKPAFNGKDYVVNVVMSAFNTDPNFRNALRE